MQGYLPLTTRTMSRKQEFYLLGNQTGMYGSCTHRCNNFTFYIYFTHYSQIIWPWQKNLDLLIRTMNISKNTFWLPTSELFELVEDSLCMKQAINWQGCKVGNVLFQVHFQYKRSWSSRIWIWVAVAMQNLPTCGFLDMACELAKSHQIASKSHHIRK